MTPRLWLAVGLVGLVAGCGNGQGAAQTGTAAKAAVGGVRVCGYAAAAAGSIPAEAAKVLPGHPALLESQATADGGSRTVALVNFPLRRAFNAIVARAQAGGWKLDGREVEVKDAEMELTRGAEQLSLSLSLANVPGCGATNVELLYTPQS